MLAQRRDQKGKKVKGDSIDLVDYLGSSQTSLHRSGSNRSSDPFVHNPDLADSVSPFEDQPVSAGPFASPADAYSDGPAQSDQVPLYEAERFNVHGSRGTERGYANLTPQPRGGQRQLVLATETGFSSAESSPLSPSHPSATSSRLDPRYAEEKAQTIAGLARESQSGRPGGSRYRSASPGARVALDEAGMPGSAGRAGYAQRLPRHQAPPGGFRRHEDAGRIDEVEDLPPLYRPEWGPANDSTNSLDNLSSPGSPRGTTPVHADTDPLSPSGRARTEQSDRDRTPDQTGHLPLGAEQKE